jgi:hypothetical protein
MAKTTVSIAHTKAWTALEQNLESFSHMCDFSHREIVLLKKKAALMSKIHIGDLSKKTERNKLVRSLNRFSTTMQQRLERYRTATLWQVVMLVTCVEAYLQDVLAAAASVDPEFMRESKQVAPYADVVVSYLVGRPRERLAPTLGAWVAKPWWTDALDFSSRRNGSEELSDWPWPSLGAHLGNPPCRRSYGWRRHR